MVMILLVVLFLLLSLLVILQINSTGKPKPYLGEDGKVLPNSISEKGFVDINGGRLGFFIKGKNLNNPVLLYLHGGMPDYFLTEKYPTRLDEMFTIVWFEQRGAGLSHTAKFKDREITIDDLISDTKEITNYLRNRFAQNKIYLMAHSGGSYLGIKTIAKYSELYAAYIGVGQISFQKLSEQKAYNYIIEQYKNKSDSKRKKVFEVLARNPVTMSEPLPLAYMRVRDYAMHDLGIGTMHNMKNVETGIFIPSLLFKEYSLKDKIDLWRGKVSSGISIIWNEMSAHDLSKENISFQTPVYFFQGKYDYTCSYELAKSYYDKIDAPKKGFYTFINSAHSPIFEEPSECIKVIRENIC